MPDLYMDVDAALAEVPVNISPLLDASTGAIEAAVTFDQAGLVLVWNFVTTAGAFTQTAVTPTESAGDYDWTNEGNGHYAIEIPATGGASINNDTEGFGWFSGVATGVQAWRGPVIAFRAAGLNNLLIDSVHSATRGLAGTALPDAAADAAGGLPISDAGALDLDVQLAHTDEVTAARMGALTDLIDGGRLDLILDAILDDTGTSGCALTANERNSIAAALLDLANSIETGWTPRMVLRVVAAALGGKVSGGGTVTNTFRDVTDTKARITATVDANGNRSAVTLDGTT